MADIERVKGAIGELAGRPKSVRFGEIERIANQLESLGYRVDKRRLSDGWIFSIDGKKFSVVTHNRGQSQLKPYYVRSFLEVMMELGLYD
jgi:hypothetical protein